MHRGAMYVKSASFNPGNLAITYAVLRDFNVSRLTSPTAANVAIGHWLINANDTAKDDSPVMRPSNSLSPAGVHRYDSA
jgi:hypothetical protein